MNHRSRRWRAPATALLLTAAATACDRAPLANTSPPNAEFLLAGGDSTYWVTSDARGTRVRSAPILLTQIDGQFYEIFLTDDGVDYEDAAFAVARVFARDIRRTDSVLLFDDGSVMKEAAEWKQRHPEQAPLDPDAEPMSAEPPTMVSEELEVLDVHGPWVTINHLLDIDVATKPHRHVGKRHVIDVRTGRRGSLRTLFGADEAQRLISAGRLSFNQLADSIRRTTDDRGENARVTLDSFRFDSTSFGLADVAREPAVAFMVPGTGTDGEALAMNLPPIRARAPDWWTVVAPTLPLWAPDSSSLRWNRGPVAVVARPADDGERLTISLRAAAGRDSAEWAVSTIRGPAFQLVSLDSAMLPPSLRSALSRAFDASATFEGRAQVAAAPSGPRRRHSGVARSTVRVLPVRANSHE